MKKLIFVFLTVILILCSCSQPSSNPYEGAKSVTGDTVFQASELANGPLYLRITNSESRITIENPEENAFYGFVFAPFNGEEKIGDWNNANVSRTGWDIFYWRNTASPMTMSPSDFGLGGDTVVYVFKAQSLSLGDKLVSPTFTAENGNRYYIADYVINTSELSVEDKANVLFFVKSSGDYSSGLFDENGNRIGNNNEPVDITGYETLHFRIFTFRNNGDVNAVEYSVFANNLTEVQESTGINISSPTSIAFSTTDTTSEYVAEIKIKNPKNNWYTVQNAINGNQGISLYTELSYSYDEESDTGTHVLYIGQIDETLRFNTWAYNRSSGEICDQHDVMTITLRKLGEADQSNILELDLSSPYSFNENEGVLTYKVNLDAFSDTDNIFIKFTGNDDPVRNAHITVESGWIINGSVNVSMNSDTSYGTWGDYITDGKASIYFEKDIVNIIFNSATISIREKNENAEKSITITVDINPYDVNVREVEIGPLLENGLSDVSPDDVILIKGLSTESLYGFTLGENGSDEWKYYSTGTLENILPNAFVINTEGDEFSFSLSEVNCNETFDKISFFEIPEGDYNSRLIISDTSEPLYTEGKLSIYGGYYDIDMTKASDYGISDYSRVLIVEDSRFNGNIIRRRNVVLGYNGSSELMSLTEDRYKVVSMWLIDTSEWEPEQTTYQYLSLTTPEICTDTMLTVSSGDAVIIPESDKARVIEYSIPDGADTLRVDSLAQGNQLVRNTEYYVNWDTAGQPIYKMYIPPMKEDGVITFPWVSRDTGEIINDSGTVMLKAFDEEDEAIFRFETLSDSDLTVEIKPDPDSSYVPILVDSSSVTGGLSGVNITISSDNLYYSLVVNYETREGRSYTEWLERWENGENNTAEFRTEGSRVWFINLRNVWMNDSSVPEDAVITLTFTK